jgi:hypothetical protein
MPHMAHMVFAGVMCIIFGAMTLIMVRKPALKTDFTKPGARMMLIHCPASSTGVGCLLPLQQNYCRHQAKQPCMC